MIHAKWCFNAVTEPRGCGSAVLIRAVEPLRGEQHMQARRQREEPRDWTRGPARLCQAFGIHKVHDGWDLTRGKTLWIAQPKDAPRPVLEVRVTPRIGLSSAQDLPLRYYVSGNQFVSGKAQK